jgi:hypothetical protein
MLMAAGEIDIHQGVRVLGATVDGTDVIVDLYGGDVNMCGTARFALADPREQAGVVSQVSRWARLDTLLTLVIHGTTVRLQDDLTVFATSAQPSTPSETL